MDILLWIVFGLVVGLVARLIMPGSDPGGIIVTIVLGIVGALLGGWLGRAIGLYREGEAAGFIMAVIGASGCGQVLGGVTRAHGCFTDAGLDFVHRQKPADDACRADKNLLFLAADFLRSEGGHLTGISDAA